MDEKTISLSNVDKMLGTDTYGKNELSKILVDDHSTSIANFDLVRTAVNKIHTTSIDYTMRRGDIELIKKDDNIYLSNKVTGVSFPFSNWALGQICGLANIPAYYIKKCMNDNDFELVLLNMSKWFNKLSPEKELLIRTTDERIHGILSNKYGIFDDAPLLQIINDTVGKQNDFTVKNYMVNPEMMNLRIIANNKIEVDGEDLHIGLNIKNSRTGQAALDVQFLMYRSACTNGMFFGGGKGEFFNKRHMGIEYDQIQNGLTEVLENMPNAILKVKSWVEESKKNILDSNSLDKLIKGFNKDFKNDKLLTSRVLQLLPVYGASSDNATVWALSQAMTEASQVYNLDTREQIEKYAGTLLQKVA